MGILRRSGAHTDSVLVRDFGLRTPSFSGRLRPSGNLSAGDIFGDSGVVVVWTSSSRIVTIVGCRMSRVTARTRRAITIKKPTSNAVLCWPVRKSRFYGAFVLNHRVVLHAIDAMPARCAPDALVDFHTGAGWDRGG